MDEKLFTSENEREKTKQRFNNYVKKMDMEIKFSEKYLENKRHIQLSKGFAAAGTRQPSIEKLEDSKFPHSVHASMDLMMSMKAIDQKKQARYKEQLLNYKLIDNEESKYLLDKLDRLKVKSIIGDVKMKGVKRLIERGLRK